MKVTQYSEGCGALISDIQLADLGDTQLEELRTVFTQHGLLFFRDQDFFSSGPSTICAAFWQYCGEQIF